MARATPWLPRAVTAAPAAKYLEFPTATVLTGVAAPSIWIRARSSAALRPSTRAANGRPARCGTDTWPATLITWSLVSTRPEGVRMMPTPADCPLAGWTCTRPGATDSSRFAWLSAPVPSSSATNTLFLDGGLGITEEAEAGPDNPPTAATSATSATAAAAPIPAASLRRRCHQPAGGFVPVAG